MIPFTFYHQQLAKGPAGHCHLIDISLTPANHSLRVCSSSICSNGRGFNVLGGTEKMVSLLNNIVISGLPMVLSFISFDVGKYLNVMSCWWQSSPNASTISTPVIHSDQKNFASASCEVPNFSPLLTSNVQIRSKDMTHVQSFNVTLQSSFTVISSFPEFVSSEGMTAVVGTRGNYAQSRLLTPSASAIKWQSTETPSPFSADLKMSGPPATWAAAAACAQE